MAKKAGTSLGLAIFFVIALLVVLIAASALAATFVGAGLARDAISTELRRVNAAQAVLNHQRLRRLELANRILTSEDWVVRSLTGASAGTDDATELRTRLEEFREEQGLDLVIFCDPQGVVVFRSGSSEKPAMGEDLSPNPLLPAAEEGSVSPMKTTTGLWALDGDLRHTVIAPLVRNFKLVGYVGVASSIAPMADELRRTTGAQVVILYNSETGPTVIASALDSARPDAVVMALRSEAQGLGRVRRGETEPAASLEIDQAPWLAFLSPLRDAADQPQGATVGLVPVGGRLLIYRQMQLLLGGVSAGALVVALLVSLAMGRRVLAPVNQLATALNQIRDGVYDAQLPRAKGNFAPLVEPIRLLARKLGDQQMLEDYLAQRGRELPEPARDESKSPPVARQLALVGVEMQRFANPKIGYDPEENIGRFARDLRRISAAVASRQGTLEAVYGHRLLALFDGEGHSTRALAAATEILLILTTRENAFDEPVAPVIGLNKGPVVTGSVRRGARIDMAVAGLAVQQLDSLMREAVPGELYLAKPFAEEIYPTLKGAGHDVQAQRGVLSPAPLYKLAAAAAQSFTGATAPAVEPHGVEENLSLSDVVPGEVLGGRFEVLAELGSGPTGAAFKCRDNDRADFVKLKVLRPELVADTARLERMRESLEMARMIAHPNVLGVLDFGQAGGLAYVSTIFVKGTPLAFFAADGQPMPLSPAFLLARQIAEGMRLAHRQKLVHGGLKPENVLIEPGGQVKVMDFAMGAALSPEQLGSAPPGSAPTWRPNSSKVARRALPPTSTPGAPSSTAWSRARPRPKARAPGKWPSASSWKGSSLRRCIAQRCRSRSRRSC